MGFSPNWLAFFDQNEIEREDGSVADAAVWQRVFPIFLLFPGIGQRPFSARRGASAITRLRAGRVEQFADPNSLSRA
jgi:hypothetical protein